jgi:DNA uptake protein ComE-like DNA-binding protein
MANRSKLGWVVLHSCVFILLGTGAYFFRNWNNPKQDGNNKADWISSIDSNLWPISATSTTVVHTLPIWLNGEVRNPGEYHAKPNLTVLQLIKMAGGFTRHANLSRIKVIEYPSRITHFVNVSQAQTNSDHDIVLKAGSAVYVSKQFF